MTAQLQLTNRAHPQSIDYYSNTRLWIWRRLKEGLTSTTLCECVCQHAWPCGCLPRGSPCGLEHMSGRAKVAGLSSIQTREYTAADLAVMQQSASINAWELCGARVKDATWPLNIHISSLWMDEYSHTDIANKRCFEERIVFLIQCNILQFKRSEPLQTQQLKESRPQCVSQSRGVHQLCVCGKLLTSYKM